MWETGLNRTPGKPICSSIIFKTTKAFDTDSWSDPQEVNLVIKEWQFRYRTQTCPCTQGAASQCPRHWLGSKDSLVIGRAAQGEGRGSFLKLPCPVEPRDSLYVFGEGDKYTEEGERFLENLSVCGGVPWHSLEVLILSDNEAPLGPGNRLSR